MDKAVRNVGVSSSCAGAMQRGCGCGPEVLQETLLVCMQGLANVH